MAYTAEQSPQRMPEEDAKPKIQPQTEIDPKLADAVSDLVWLIAEEFVEAYQEAMWIEEMLPEPQVKPRSRTAGKGSSK